MFKNYFKISALILVAALSITSCSKDRGWPIKTPKITGTKGIYVLCEGNFSVAPSDNSVISYYNVETNTTATDFYKNTNGTAIGHNANDLQAYGSKMYCVITGSGTANNSFVDVINISSGKSLKRISLNNGQPRNIAFANGKAYVSRYDGKITRIDTASMNVDGELQLLNGTNPAAFTEDLAVANGKLYITGGSYYVPSNTYNNKIVVVDLGSFTKIKEITVAYNPQKLAVLENGDLFLLTGKDYGVNNSPSLQRISSVTDEVTQTQEVDLGNIAINKNFAWVSATSIKALNVTTNMLGNDLITDGTTISLPYGLTINNFDNTVLVNDAVSYSSRVGKVYVFTSDGKKKYAFDTAVFPRSAVFNYSYK
jgi:hypothetical protein